MITKKCRLEWQHAEQQQLQNNALKEFQKEDLLHPVITVVLYFGSDPWAGPRSVHDMLADLPPELLEFIPDYKLHLIELASLSDSQLQKFQSHLREVLFCLKHANHKEQLHTLLQDPQFRAIPYEAAALLNEFLGLNFDLTGKQKGDIISLCTAQDPMPPAPPCSTNEISS